jgi:methyl-accepting chemotaxis protein
MTIGKRMTFGFSLLTLITIGLGLFIHVKLRSIDQSTTSVATDSLPGLKTILQVKIVQGQNALNLQSYTIESDHTEMANIESNIKKVGGELVDLMDKYEKTITADEDRRQFEEIKRARMDFTTIRDRILTLTAANKADEARHLFNTEGKPALERIDKAIATSVEYNSNNADRQIISLTTAVNAGRTGLIIGISIAILVAIVVSILTIRAINNALKRIAASLSSGSEQVAAASSQVSSSSQSLAQGASEQAASLEETSSALEEMSSMTKKNAESAQQAAALAADAKSAADKGNREMDRMGTAIAEIEKSATETAKIIKVIDEIAFQTNLLALNAAVEAARAGEAGKGFAVVAEEVRNLAMRSAEAAKNTAAMIEESVKSAKNGVQIATEVGKTLAEITGSNQKVNALISEIAAASAEQAQGIGQVNTAVTQMDKVTQSNAAAAEESASASEELSSQAMELNGVVSILTQLVTGKESETSARAERRPVRKSNSAPQVKASKPKAAPHKSLQALPLDDMAESKNEFASFNA